MNGTRRASQADRRWIGWIGCLVVLLALCSCGSPQVESVVLVVVDTLRADALGVAGYHRPTSPEIDDWARHARFYERAYSSSPWTLPAVGTILTGIWPGMHGAGQVGGHDGSRPRFTRLKREVVTVAELVSDRGWETAALINNHYLDREFGLDRGFNTWDFHPSSARGYRAADRTVDRAIEWLDANRRERFFLLIHLFDPHLPYQAPERYAGHWERAPLTADLSRPVREIRAMLQSDDGPPIEALRSAYDQEVRFTDAQVGRLLRALQDLGLANRTAVLLTADHGEEFQDHGGFEHGHTLYDELLLVPLILSIPGEPGRRIEAPVSLVDVAPTVIDLLGLPVPPVLAGVSLLHPRPAGERIFFAHDLLYGPPRQAIVRWPWKLIVFREKVRLYRLDHDPDETKNLATQRPRVVTALRKELAASGTESWTEDRAAVSMDEETRRDLESLGYLE